MTQYFPCSSYPDKKLWQTHGADALTYVRFLRMCFLCCLVTTTISCSILLPLNLSGWPLHIVTHTHTHHAHAHARVLMCGNRRSGIGFPGRYGPPDDVTPRREGLQAGGPRRGGVGLLG